CLRGHPFGVCQVEAFWNSFRHGLGRPWSVSQFQLSLLAHSRWVQTACGKVALAMPSPTREWIGLENRVASVSCATKPWSSRTVKEVCEMSFDQFRSRSIARNLG